MSKPLAAAMEKFGVQTIYGNLQVGEVLQLGSLAHTLDVIADTPVEGWFFVFAHRKLCISFKKNNS